MQKIIRLYFLVTYSVEEELEKTMDRITVQRNVFQSLIQGSGVNWAQDDRLLDLMVRLSDQPSL